MVASGVGQFSINVKSNLKDFYGELTKAQRTMKELTERQNKLQIDSSKLNELRDKAQRIAAEMKELRQQKTEIKLGVREVDDAKAELKNLDQQIASLNRQKLEVESDIQPIRTANAELYKTEQEIDRLNNQKVEVDFGSIGDKLDELSNKVMSVVKAIGTMSFAGLAASVGVLKEAVNAASDLEQNLGGVKKLYEESNETVVENSKKAYKTAGMSQNEYLEAATSFSASLITSLQEGQTKTTDSSAEKEALKKRKAEIEKQLKENSYSSSELSLNSEKLYTTSTDSKGKVTKKAVENTQEKAQLKSYKQNALDLKKEKDKIDEQIANLPESTTEKVGGMSKADAQKKAAQYVDMALVDMSDNANTYGTSQDLVQNAYEGIAKNNYTMIDNLKLGFKATQEGAIDAVNTYGGLDHKITDISEVTFPMMIDAIHNAQKAMLISGTTASEAASTYEGSFKMMKGAWKDFLSTGDGSGLEFAIPIYLDNLDKKLKDLTPKLIEGIKKMVKVLPAKLKPVMEDIGKILSESLNAIFGEKFTKNFLDGMKPFTDIFKRVIDMLSKSTKGKKPDLSWAGSVVPDLLKLAAGLKIASLAFKGIQFAQGMGLSIPKISGISSLGSATTEMKKVGVNDLKKLGLKMLTVAGISANIYLAAKALKEVNKVGDLGGLQPKMLAIAEAVVGMGVIAAAVGKVNQLLGNSVTTGVLLIAGIAADIYVAAKALKEVGDIDSDFGSLQSKIGQIALSITEIGVLAAAVGALMDTGIGAAVLASGLVAIAGIAGTINLVAKALAKLSALDLNKEVINNNIKTISTVLEEISKIKFHESFLTSFIKSGIADNLKKMIDELIEITDGFEDLQGRSIITDSLTGTIGAIQEGITSITNIKFNESMISSFLKNGVSGNINSMIQSVLAISNSFEDLQGRSIIADSLTGEIESIQTGITAITGIKYNESALSSFLKKDISNNIKNVLSTIIGITDSFEDLEGRSIVIDSLTDEIDVIQNGITAITNIKFNESMLSSFLKDGVSGNIKNLVNTIISITDSFEDLQGRSLMLDSLTNDEKTGELDIIQKGINAITGIKFDESMLSSFLKDGVSDNIKSMIDTIIKITDGFEDLQGRSLMEDSLTDEIGIIQAGINAISKITFDNDGGLDSLKNAKSMMSELSEIADILEDLQGRSLMSDSITNDEGGGELDIIKNAIDSISSFATGGIVDNLSGLSDALDILIADLTKTYPKEFSDLGKTFGKNVTTGFKEKLNLQSALTSAINSLSVSGAESVAGKLARAINDGLSKTLNVGDKIRESIEKALEGKNSKLTFDVVVNKKATKKSSKTVKAGGGLVNQDAILQDSPEMPLLQNGEYVVPEKIVKALGVPFFDKLRNGQVSRTFAGLAQSVSNTTSSVVNNIYNNTTNQNNNMYVSGNQDLVLTANRRLR